MLCSRHSLSYNFPLKAQSVLSSNLSFLARRLVDIVFSFRDTAPIRWLKPPIWIQLLIIAAIRQFVRVALAVVDRIPEIRRATETTASFLAVPVVSLAES